MDFTKHKEEFSVSVNGFPIGAISYYSVSYEEKHYDTEEEAVAGPKLHYVITIKRQLESEHLRENYNFYIPEKFNVHITRCKTKVKFDNCQLEGILEDLGEDRMIYQTLVFSGISRVCDYL